MSPMKEDKKLGELEPTLSDVLEAVQVGFTKVETVLDRHEKMINTLVAGQENLTERVKGIDQRLTVTQNRVEDVAEMLEDMTEVVDENRDILFKHESRITVLEKAVV